jgi:tetratricopeptide (TPR) repeat protein
MALKPQPAVKFAAPALIGASATSLGDSASANALTKLNQAMSELKAQATAPFLNQALADMRADRHQEGAEWALKALDIDERCGLGWHILAICREKAGDYVNSLKCYEHALALEPDNAEIALNLGRLAYQMNLKPVAEKLFHHYLLHFPGSTEGTNNLACCLRDQCRFDEAIEALRPVIMANPECAMLWNTLATVLTEQGELEQAITFYDEALRIEPGFAKARYNRGNSRLHLGDPNGGLVDCEEALKLVTLESEAAMMKLSRSTILLAAGRIGEGWDAYDIRLDPAFGDATSYLIKAPAWTPETDVAGKQVVVFGEQGLGDEVLFANALPDLIADVGADGTVSIVVEPRLVPLFQRSFPTAKVDGHQTYKVEHRTIRGAPLVEEAKAIDCWAPMGSLLRRYRRTLDAFPGRERFLTPDPDRVAYWKGQLEALGGGPTVGIVWKSLLNDSGRRRFFSPFERWRPILSTPGVSFVNLQYGDCAAEIAEAKAALGVEIWTPPGIDLKNDLDEVAALSAAVDLVIGPANAATNIAAAVGAPVWFISIPGAWPRLGADNYPWYPQARAFRPAAYNDWGPVMAEIAEALKQTFG